MTDDLSKVNPSVVVPGIPSPSQVAAKRNPVPAKSSSRNPAPQRAQLLDEDQELALDLVIKNYNAHRDPSKPNARALTRDLVYVMSFNRWGKNWSAIVRSTIVRRLWWSVTLEERTSLDANECSITSELFVHIEVLGKIDSETIRLG